MCRRTAILLLLGLVLVSGASAEEADRPSADGDFAPVDLSHVVDRTEVSFEEADAYYGLLDQARNVPTDRLRAAAADLLRDRWEASPKFQQWPISEFPLYYDLTQKNPDKYRGRPVTMHGHLIRLVTYAAGPNDYGIETLYEGWLVTPDSQTHPVTIVCTEIPSGMPIGEEVTDGVSVTGYFFKLHTYSSRDRKTRFAPMVLARTMNWSLPDEAATGWPISQTAILSALLLFALLAGIIAWVSARRTRTPRDARFQSDVPSQPPEFLKDLSP